MIFKLVAGEEWSAACEEGIFHGSCDDVRDGFIHFSAPHQVRETAARHFKGVHGLLLVACDEAALGAALRWERSRGGDLFPHLYGPLPTALALWSKPLAPGDDGAPDIPADILAC
jgi:uncharacterized protein (DUF952 family)